MFVYYVVIKILKLLLEYLILLPGQSLIEATSQLGIFFLIQEADRLTVHSSSGLYSWLFVKYYVLGYGKS